MAAPWWKVKGYGRKPSGPPGSEPKDVRDGGPTRYVWNGEAAREKAHEEAEAKAREEAMEARYTHEEGVEAPWEPRPPAEDPPAHLQDWHPLSLAGEETPLSPVLQQQWARR